MNCIDKLKSLITILSKFSLQIWIHWSLVIYHLHLVQTKPSMTDTRKIKHQIYELCITLANCD